jgi:hypothetical protein
MKSHRLSLFLMSTTAVACIAILHCTNPATSALTDAQQLAALRNVTVTCDSMTYAFGLPQGALGGKSFSQLLAEDSATYANPANYSITVILNMTADNTHSGAADAAFDGMKINVVMDTIVSTPIQTVADPFTVSKGTKKSVPAHGTINLATHRKAGLYIFRQTVAGADLATTLSPLLDYKIGSLAGSIPLPDIKQNIPTRASAETKAFLSGLLSSGVLGAN